VNIHQESELTRLPEPVAPASLVGAVMARVSRLDEQRTPASVAFSISMGRSQKERIRSWNGPLAGVATFAGLAIVLVSWIDGRLDTGSWPSLISLHVGAPNGLRLPPDISAALGLALGLLLYLGGLFAPLRSRR
jgi:hypothetical protein